MKFTSQDLSLFLLITSAAQGKHQVSLALRDEDASLLPKDAEAKKVGTEIGGEDFGLDLRDLLISPGEAKGKDEKTKDSGETDTTKAWRDGEVRACLLWFVSMHLL